jgi:hypothetical protein
VTVDAEQQSGFRIFINYRREDSAAHAGRLYDALIQRWPEEQVFIDIDAIPPGVDFVEVIGEAVGKCDVLIAFVGRHWVDMTDQAGRRRLDNPEDFVRLELEAALARDVRVIPLLVDGAAPPASLDLPESLRPFARRNAFEIYDTRWRSDLERLVAHLRLIEAERLAKEEALQQEAERERRARAEEEAEQQRRIMAEQEAEREAERERQARAEQAERERRARAEHAEQERLAKAEQERRAKAEQERMAKAEQQRPSGLPEFPPEPPPPPEPRPVIDDPAPPNPLRRNVLIGIAAAAAVIGVAVLAITTLGGSDDGGTAATDPPSASPSPTVPTTPPLTDAEVLYSQIPTESFTECIDISANNWVPDVSLAAYHCRYDASTDAYYVLFGTRPALNDWFHGRRDKVDVGSDGDCDKDRPHFGTWSDSDHVTRGNVLCYYDDEGYPWIEWTRWDQNIYAYLFGVDGLRQLAPVWRKIE